MDVVGVAYCLRREKNRAPEAKTELNTARAKIAFSSKWADIAQNLLIEAMRGKGLIWCDKDDDGELLDKLRFALDLDDECHPTEDSGKRDASPLFKPSLQVSWGFEAEARTQV
jgi:hypothetical protein